MKNHKSKIETILQKKASETLSKFIYAPKKVKINWDQKDANLEIENDENYSALNSQELKEKIWLNSEDSTAYYHHAKLSFEQCKWNSAKYDFMKLMEQESFRMEWPMYAGICAGISGDYMDAIQLFDKAIELDQNQVELYQFRGMMNLVVGFEDRAMEDFEKGGKISEEIEEIIDQVVPRKSLVPEVEVREVEEFVVLNEDELVGEYPALKDGAVVFDNVGILTLSTMQSVVKTYLQKNDVLTVIFTIKEQPKWSSSRRKLALDILNYKLKYSDHSSIMVILIDASSGEIELLTSPQLNQFIPNFKCKSIIVEMIPDLKNHKYDKAIVTALDEARKMLRNKQYYKRSHKFPVALFITVLISAVVLFLYSKTKDSANQCPRCKAPLTTQSSPNSILSNNYQTCNTCNYTRAIPKH